MKKQIVFYSILLVACSIVILTFVTSKTYVQLAIASLLYPPLAYFAFKYYPRKTQKIFIDKNNPEATPIIEETDDHIGDIDKRTFLKMIGAAGFSLLIFSIFTKRFESLFMGNDIQSNTSSTNGNSVNSVDPAERQPTDGYQISEIDEETDVYIGYTNKYGAWFIMKQDLETGSFRYTKGGQDFPDNWVKRQELTYDYFNNVFSPE